jgi:ferrous iron transport protein A
MTAADLKFGQKAKIDSLDKTHPSSFRLLEYGFTPGQDIEMMNTSIFKDPIQLSIRGALIAIRKSDAKCINIKLNENF